jgi:hypothetical protein
MDLYDRLGIKSTFNVEVVQQLAHEAWADRYPEIALQRDLWIEAVESMCRRGFDVQLHIHPHWYEAEYDGQWWKLGRRWHIVDYSPQEIRRIVSRAVEYLARLTAPAKIVAFRAGSWGMGPPSREIIETLLEHGIQVDVSMLQGAYYRSEVIQLDYTKLERPYQAYVPDLDDIRKVGSRPCGLVAVPTQTVPRSLVLEPLLRSPRQVIEKLVTALSRVKAPPTPSHVVRDPLGLISGSGRMDFTLDLSCQYSSLGFKWLTDICINRALKARDRDFQVLVFSNHTKDLQRDYQFARIASTIRHIRRKYPEIAFVTLSQVAERAAELV